MNRLHRAALASALVAAVAFAAALARPQETASVPVAGDAAALAPQPGQPEEARVVASRLQNGHYRRLGLGDRLSDHMLTRYLDFLDPWHGLFTAGDIEQVERYRFKLDDALRTGKLEPAFEI